MKIATLTNHRTVRLTILALVTAIFLQFLHFYLYFDRSASESLLWSSVDWTVWFLFMGLVYSKISPIVRSLEGWHRITFLMLIVILAGPCQIILSSLIYVPFAPPSEGLIAEWLYLFDKRWFQHLLYAFALWHFFRNIHASAFTSNSDGHEATIEIRDGRAHYWLKASEVTHILAEGNYVTVNTTSRSLLVRDTLKKFEERLIGMGFVRVSRSVIVNSAFLEAVEPYSRHSKHVKLTTGVHLNVGRTYATDLADKLATWRQYHA
ncbi:LytR/AlgR family response regulator transcription factor [Kordiimonas aquimaris]|uniref:LytR/AlgR family response regulator transcription factor n=1 Tax=Kordiimonas aquimaris TaxID=707591 RepID=UPI0021CFEC13|nr:LytTR family DNA-binding domain-containing protein [Kordiimonas aquimaris]